MENVIFGASTMDIIKAMHNHSQGPALVSHISHLILFGKDKPHWFLLFEPTKCNSEAFLIAKSVTEDLRLSFYATAGFPIWLKGLFLNEQRLVFESLNPSFP